MRIAVVSFWWNEARLAPFFLSHYAWADKIRLVIDTESTDACREIAAAYPNVEIEDSSFPGGLLDDGLKVGRYNEIFRDMDYDWGIAVDADELIFPTMRENPQKLLARQTGNLMMAEMWSVYRHKDDADLHPAKPAIWQRRHGDPVVSRSYRKSIVVKPEVGIEWLPGNHVYKPNLNILPCNEKWRGAHWQNADVEIAITRRLAGRRDRLSENNKRNNWGIENLSLTDETIRAECAAHLNDPQLF